MSRTLTQTEEKKTLTSRRELPLDPPVSVKDLRDCIPAHCWKRDNLTSFGYLVKDILLISITGWLAYTFIDSVPFFAVRVALWIAYVFFQVRFCLSNAVSVLFRVPILLLAHRLRGKTHLAEPVSELRCVVP
eukprot:TRINITY_DN532_c0_g1_i2.p4 TRINITY_DN532_c0_g1~~TRINITY_DN532_c0_g1_i2.p4  ORF type:complete len:132 (-),score=19.16 TRINITY_DN532_c0_g1_i2:1043-1438(-)